MAEGKEVAYPVLRSLSSVNPKCSHPLDSVVDYLVFFLISSSQHSSLTKEEEEEECKRREQSCQTEWSLSSKDV